MKKLCTFRKNWFIIILEPKNKKLKGEKIMNQNVGQFTQNFNSNINFEVKDRCSNEILFKGTIHGLSREIREKVVYLVYSGQSEDKVVELTIYVY